MNNKWWIVAAVFLFGLTGCAASLQTATPEAGTTLDCRLDAFRYNGFARTYRLHIPRNYTPTKPGP